MPKSRLSVLLSLLLVFLSGALVGGFAHKLYSTTVNAGPPPRRTPEDFRSRYVSDMRTRLQLDDDQVGQLGQILNQIGHETDQKMREIRNEQIEKINAMLRPEQKPMYEQFRAEREKARRQRDRHDKK
jgi:hypothetical protein